MLLETARVIGCSRCVTAESCCCIW